MKMSGGEGKQNESFICDVQSEHVFRTITFDLTILFTSIHCHVLRRIMVTRIQSIDLGTQQLSG